MTATVCGMGQLQSNPVRRTTLLLLIVCGATFFAGLGRPAIGDSDEAFYAEAGREMVGSGDWITPYYNFETRFQKPILFYWVVSAGYLVAGVNEAAARWGSALAGLGLALLTAACGRRWYDERTGRLAGLVVATAFGYFSIGPAGVARPSARLLDHAHHLVCHRRTVRQTGPSPPWLMLAGAAVGLGFLTKGPVAIVVPALVVVPICWLERRHVRLPVRADGRSGDHCRRDCRALVRRDGADPRQQPTSRASSSATTSSGLPPAGSTTRGLPGSTCRSSRAACCPGRR